MGLVAVGAGHNPAGDLRFVAQQFKGVGVALADRFALHQGAVGVVGIRVVVGVAARRGKVILCPLAQRLLEIAQHPHCVAAGLRPGLRDDAVDLVEHRLLLLVGQVEIAEAEGHLIIAALVIVVDKFGVIAQKALGVVPAWYTAWRHSSMNSSWSLTGWSRVMVRLSCPWVIAWLIWR